MLNMYRYTDFISKAVEHLCKHAAARVVRGTLPPPTPPKM